MRGIATIDRQPDSDSIAVWVTSQSEPLAARNTNAVVIDVDDAEALMKVRSLTRCCAVLLTDGSVLDGLPVEGEPLTSADIDALVLATQAHQEAIHAAVVDYKQRRRSTTLVVPTFPRLPKAADFVPSEDTPGQRAFATANYLGSAWTAWLKTDEERRRRTARPKSGETPYMMPDELNAPEVSPFPPRLGARLHEQPLV